MTRSSDNVSSCRSISGIIRHDHTAVHSSIPRFRQPPGFAAAYSKVTHCDAAANSVLPPHRRGFDDQSDRRFTAAVRSLEQPPR
ncbi:hypothetical protein NJ7G_0996 [Natrinema sp. J7-2]|nr:hypothetical protein NJ7G_0996 [Natrinema sp. J7-2]